MPRSPLPGSFFAQLWASPAGQRRATIRPAWHVAGIQRLHDRATSIPVPLSVAVEAHVPGVPGPVCQHWPVFRVGEQADPGAATRGRGRAGGRTNSRSGCRSPVVPQEVPASTSPDRRRRRSSWSGARESKSIPAFECEVMERGRWLGGKCQLPNCPLIVDTARDGYKLTSVENGVRFDLNADGVPEQVAWTTPRFGRCVSGAGSERQRTHRRWVGAVRQPHAGASRQPGDHDAERVRGVEVRRDVGLRPERAQRSHRRARRRVLATGPLARPESQRHLGARRAAARHRSRASRPSAPSTRTASASTRTATSSASARACSGRTASTTTSSTCGCTGGTDRRRG